MQKDQQKLAELIQGKKVAFIGAGVSHKTLIKEFVELGAHVTLCDQKKSVEDFGDYAATIRELGIDLSLGENYLDGFKGQDIIMRTPGFVGYFEKPLQDAMAAGTMVTSEVELFFDFCPCEIVAVTGSDGKTTTTTLISKFYEAAGRRVHLGGNIGAALLPMLPEVSPDDVAVVELSSFQLISMHQSPDIAGAVEPELAEGEDEDTLGAGDQGVMVGYACNETPEYLPMPVVAAQRLVTLLEISRMTGVIPDIGPDGKVQITMEYNGDTPVRITTVVVSVQHKEDTDINKLADLLDEYVFPLAFDGMPADDAEIILNPSGKFVQGGPDADTGLTGRKLMVDSYGTFAPHGGGAFSGKDATKVDRSAAYMARFIAKNIVAAGFAQRCQVTLAYAIGEKEPVMVDVNTFGTGICEDDCLSAAVRKAYDLTPAGIIKQLNLLNPMYSRTAAGGHFGREDFPWENIEHMSDLAAYIV